jgi:hypothetical protein
MTESLTDTIIHFLRSIGLTVQERTIAEPTVLPGITVDRGELVVDREKLLYPGDLLHEAGHLAVIPAAERASLHQNVGDDGGMEMGAIAWSYAAASHLSLPSDVVFHGNGYRGDASSLIENFAEGRYLGVPVLVWRGLAEGDSAAPAASTHYPKMKRWLAA